ncbi:MAG TPA: hypothetical protein VIH04_06240 [Nitrosarchaeum sp.]
MPSAVKTICAHVVCVSAFPRISYPPPIGISPIGISPLPVSQAAKELPIGCNITGAVSLHVLPIYIFLQNQ